MSQENETWELVKGFEPVPADVNKQSTMQGDVNVPFTLQSCSKPFTYGICLNELGPEVDLTNKS
jgi:glutaminase